MAKPDIYACSALTGPAEAAKEAPADESTQDERAPSDDAIDVRARDQLGVGDGRGGGDDGEGASTPLAALRQTSPGGGAEMVGGGLRLSSAAREEEEELPSAVLISRSVEDASDGCTFEAKVREEQRRKTWRGVAFICGRVGRGGGWGGAIWFHTATVRL